MSPRCDSQCFSGVLHATPKEIPGVLVHEVNVATFHTASQKNAVSVLYHLRESVTRSFHHSVVGLGFVSLPICCLGYVD
jgi:hypothetical protein